MFFLRLTLVMAVFVAFAALPAGAQQAIFTTNQAGTCVNCNHYESKADVYLDGGPLNCGPGGLPDGDYYFQVTNTSGSDLLSTDPAANRLVTFSGGRITGYSGSHATATGHCGPGTLSVALADFGDSSNGVYKVWVTPTTSLQTDPACNPDTENCFVDGATTKTDNFKVLPGEVPPEANVLIGGEKFYDADADGVLDGGELGILGWKIELREVLDSLLADDVTYTDTNGFYSFVVGNDTHTYRITEVLPSSAAGTWINTTALFQDVTVPLSQTDINFGNVCVGPGGGKTLGFWSNKNGQAAMNDGGSLTPELALLSGLNLRDASGNDFDPANYAAFRNWILSATATNMAYMLSAQLAAMELNVEAGFVGGGALVYVGPSPGTSCLEPNAAGFISVNALMTAANAQLGLDGYTPAGDENRQCQEYLKTALDNANNNKTFVQPGPESCPFSY